mmetsp:Transcript_27711/g.40918  ORF Transcript_27711/g.40918 Transcript_27711/m.40918 type:complete len:253 (-) Transcript_27711:75-833(-)
MGNRNGVGHQLRVETNRSIWTITQKSGSRCAFGRFGFGARRIEFAGFGRFPYTKFVAHVFCNCNRRWSWWCSLRCTLGRSVSDCLVSFGAIRCTRFSSRYWKTNVESESGRILHFIWQRRGFVHREKYFECVSWIYILYIAFSHYDLRNVLRDSQSLLRREWHSCRQRGIAVECGLDVCICNCFDDIVIGQHYRLHDICITLRFDALYVVGGVKMSKDQELDDHYACKCALLGFLAFGCCWRALSIWSVQYQ